MFIGKQVDIRPQRIEIYNVKAELFSRLIKEKYTEVTKYSG